MSNATTVERDELTDEMLNEVCGEVAIGSLTYLPADVLAAVDPIAYRVTVNEYRDSLCSDGMHGEPETDDELGRCTWCGTPRTEIEAGE